MEDRADGQTFHLHRGDEIKCDCQSCCYYIRLSRARSSRKFRGRKERFFLSCKHTVSYTLKNAEEILSLHTGRTGVIPMKLTAVLIHRLRSRAHIVTSYYCENLVLSELYITSCCPDDGLRRGTLRRGSLNTFNCAIVCLARLPISAERFISNLRRESIAPKTTETMRACELIASFPQTTFSSFLSVDPRWISGK